MKFKRFGNKYFLRIDKGKEIIAELKKFCKEQNIKLGTITGIGATNKAVIGLFETATKQYHKKLFIGDHEITSLVGNITTMNGEAYLHIHINLGDIKNRAFSSHLNSAIVSATFEAVIEKIHEELEREFDEETGLNLLKL
jgi:hypothetical protein